VNGETVSHAIRNENYAVDPCVIHKQPYFSHQSCILRDFVCVVMITHAFKSCMYCRYFEKSMTFSEVALVITEYNAR